MSNLRVSQIMDVWVEDFLFDRQPSALVQWQVGEVLNLVDTSHRAFRSVLRQMV